jgi:hypothetical protein
MLPVYLKDDNFEEPAEPLYYLVAKNGVFLVKNNEFFHSVTRVRGLPWLNRQKESLTLKLPLVPKSLLNQALGFFLEVFRQHTAESLVHLYYNPAEQRYQIEVPPQRVSGEACYYKINMAPPGWRRIGTIHSHGLAEAFHSQQDQKDERHDDGLHITFGNLDQPDWTLSVSFVVDGKRFPVDPHALLGEDLVFTPEKGLLGELDKVSVEPKPKLVGT